MSNFLLEKVESENASENFFSNLVASKSTILCEGTWIVRQIDNIIVKNRNRNMVLLNYNEVNYKLISVC